MRLGATDRSYQSAGKRDWRRLGCARLLVEKLPTADLESLKPQLADEEAMGVTYAEIDAFLSGQEVSEQAYTTITRTYQRTEHKRQLPKTP